MNNADLIQQLAALNWLIRSDHPQSSSSTSNSASSSTSGEEAGRQIYTFITGIRVVDEIYQRITKKREIEQAWSGVILRVAEFVKKNPRASEKEQVDFVRNELVVFEIYVNSL